MRSGIGCTIAAIGGVSCRHGILPQQPTFGLLTQPVTPCTRGVKITRRSTLLIDDDAKNIEHALRNGVKAVLFQIKKPGLCASDMLELEQ